MNWKRADNVVWEELDGGALLIQPHTGARWSLNAAATAVWKCCDGRASVAELAALMKRSGDEIAAFCQQFREIGLLTPAVAAVSSDGRPVLLQANFRSAPGFKPLGLGAGPRRRPTPRGNSGPG